MVLYRLNVKLISYDRPGYGGSDRQERRNVAAAADDVAAIADSLGIPSFAVVGRSGGGPHALACAARLPDRVTRAAVLVGMAPADADGLNWYQGMNRENVIEYSAADPADPSEVTERLRVRADATRVNPQTLLAEIEEQMSEADKRIVQDISIRRLLTSSYGEAVRTGPYGWIDDVLAFRNDWGFSLEDIHCPVLLWHGEDDTFSPVEHTRWMKSKIGSAEVVIRPDAAHFGAVEILPDLLSWLTGSPVPSGR
jgi:pimeloyl-ACP methyl ester carboxylesterase